VDSVPALERRKGMFGQAGENKSANLSDTSEVFEKPGACVTGSL
jgi:hypothetical protein